MKTLLILFIALLPLQWETDFDTALKTAREKNKLVLLSFSGSDWCAPCIQTKREYFESESFIKMAKENLVLVNADFPRRKKNQLSAEQTKKNEALAEKYNKEGNFPYTLLLDANGKIIKSWKGKPDAPVDEWVGEVKKIRASYKK
jgi:thioredoxin-related protein